MLKKLIAGAALTAAVAGSVLAGAAGPQADEAQPRLIGNCPSGQFCLAPKIDFVGTGFGSASNVSQVPSYINDKSKSAYNHGTQCRVLLYQNAGYTGRAIEVKVGHSPGDLSKMNFANMASSFRWC